MEWVFLKKNCGSCCGFPMEAVVCLLILLGVRSLANASRARQFNLLNPPGVGWVPLPQTNMAAVVGRARSYVVGRARSCVPGRSFVVIRGRAWSCTVVHGRSCVVGQSCAVGRAWSCRSARFAASTAASTAVTRTNERRKERTNEQHLITP